MAKTLIYLQPTPVRIWHWINATGFLTLILSGIQIRFPEYVNLFGSFKSAISLHNTAGIVVALSFSFWFFYYKMISGNIFKLYMPNSEDIRHGLLRQGMFYFFRYFKGAPNPHHITPENKFNPLQKSAYLAVMFILVPLVSLTGILIMNVTPLRDLVVLAGGLKILAGMHFMLACSLCAFLFTHVYLATLGHTPLEHFKPMWTGWEEVDESEAVQHDGHLTKAEPGR